MMNVRRYLSVIFILGIASVTQGADPVSATIESTLKTRGDQVRQLALDGDAATCFESEKGPTAEDHFTISLERPVVVTSITATTGHPDRSGMVTGGSLEVSGDGRSFTKVANFSDGKALTGSVSQPVRAIRIRPGASTLPIAVREIEIQSDPPVSVFRYPLEFVVTVEDSPELKAWADKAARASERVYPMINDELKSDGFKPPRVIWLTLSKTYRGVAGTVGDRIVASSDYFRRHPDDIGAIVHETVHVVQAYRGGDNPGWLVEGISDYIRFYKYEPGRIGRIDPVKSHYDNGYRASAAFLAYVAQKYDKEIVRKLNGAMREGRYDDNMIHRLTGRFLGELDDEWRATLRP